jgi:outer membrane receptor protein involved in Fe transport
MYTQREMNNVMLSGKHRLDGWDFAWKNAFTYSSIEDPDFKISSLSIDETSGDTLLRRGDGARLDRFYRNLDEMNNSSKVDVTRTMKLNNGRETKIRFGGAYTFKERDYSIILSQFDYRMLNGGLPTSGNPDWYFQEENIYDPATGVGTYLLSTDSEPSNTFNARQTTAAVYLMNELPVSTRLKAIYGVRVEQNDMFYTGQNQQGTIRLADSNTLSELNFLPSVNTVYSMNENMNLRASYNRTVARPSFKEKSIAQIFDPISKITFIGNLDLQQTDIDNIDLRWEFFPKLGELISVTAFYKVFQGHIEMAIFETATDNVKPVNSGTSTVTGLEFECRKDLSFISDSNSVWSIGANFSWMQSRLDMSTVLLPQNEQTELEVRQDNARIGEVVDRYRPMAGQSPYLINANINYTDEKHGVEANVSYNVQGKSLSIVGIGLVPDVYTQPVHMVNARLGLKVGQERNGQLSLRVDNLLNQNRVQKYESYGATSQVYSFYRDGHNFILGYSLNF